MLKALPSNDPAFVTFHNCSNRTIDIIWYDFAGKLVRYGSLKPGCSLDINTFSDHPFKCFDSESGVEMLCNGRSVYYPESFRQIHQRLQLVHIPMRSLSCRRSPIYVTSPLGSLIELCEASLMRFIENEEDIKSFGLPQTLCERLKALYESRNSYRNDFREHNASA